MITYSSFDHALWPYIFILLAGVLPTAVWRWAGVFLVGNMDEHSQAMVLVRCIATALVAAVIAQFVFAPTGALSQVPLWLRAAATLIAFAAFLAAGRRLLVPILVGEAILIAGILYLGVFPSTLL
ncbi:MAG: AzlD domain-containing protein [Pseudomonadota bacterium]